MVLVAEVVPPHRAIPCGATVDHASSGVAGNSRTEHGALGVIPSYTWAIWVQNSYPGAIEVENRRETCPITKSAPRRAGDCVVANP